MNHDTLLNISRYGNVKNLLLTSKEMYSLNSEHIVKNILKKNIKDFIYIETVEALSYLIQKVINKNRSDLLEGFINKTPYRKLSLIVCSCLINKYAQLHNEESEYKIQKILNILNCTFEELVIVLLLLKGETARKQVIKLNMLNKKDLKYFEELYKEYKSVDILRYIYENQTSLKNIPINYEYMGKIKFNHEIHSLISYRRYIQQLVYNEFQVNKNELFEYRNIRYMSKTNEILKQDPKQICNMNPRDKLIKHILTSLHIEKISGLLLIECYGMSEIIQRSLEEFNNTVLLCVLSRKYNIITENLIETYSKNYREFISSTKIKHNTNSNSNIGSNNSIVNNNIINVDTDTDINSNTYVGSLINTKSNNSMDINVNTEIDNINVNTEIDNNIEIYEDTNLNQSIDTNSNNYIDLIINVKPNNSMDINVNTEIDNINESIDNNIEIDNDTGTNFNLDFQAYDIMKEYRDLKDLNFNEIEEVIFQQKGRLFFKLIDDNRNIKFCYALAKTLERAYFEAYRYKNVKFMDSFLELQTQNTFKHFFDHFAESPLKRYGQIICSNESIKYNSKYLKGLNKFYFTYIVMKPFNRLVNQFTHSYYADQISSIWKYHSELKKIDDYFCISCLTKNPFVFVTLYNMSYENNLLNESEMDLVNEYITRIRSSYMDDVNDGNNFYVNDTEDVRDYELSILELNYDVIKKSEDKMKILFKYKYAYDLFSLSEETQRFEDPITYMFEKIILYSFVNNYFYLIENINKNFLKSIIISHVFLKACKNFEHLCEIMGKEESEILKISLNIDEFRTRT